MDDEHANADAKIKCRKKGEQYGDEIPDRLVCA
jgi:hypothetical protein